MDENSQKLPSTTLVILGVTGDLSRRYLLPALAEICRNSEVMAKLNIIGASRRDISVSHLLDSDTATLAGQFETFKLDYTEASDYAKLKRKLEESGSAQVIFYFAVPPAAVPGIVDMLGESGMNAPRYRLLMEKPFGSDLGSAQTLIERINLHFKEEQVYRIDHYLAKEMAQNIIVFLDSNALFRNVWNNQFIERIEIVAEESIGIEGREHFYEQTGALRDIIQSHLLQLAAITLMEPCPDVLDISMTQSRRLAALRHLNIKPDSVVFGQYKGYKEEVSNPQSQTETFISLELESDDDKWRGVPIKLITGKKLKEKLTEIRVYFKKTQDSQTNLLRMRIQPREAIELMLWIKKPGYDQQLQKLPLDFSYQQHFDRLPDAYEQVIVDAVRGRDNLFAGSQEVLASWQILQPIIDLPDRQLRIYKPGGTVDEVVD